MKKKILIVAVLCTALLGGVAGAASLNGDYAGQPIVKIRIDGMEIHPEVPGFIQDGNTMLPLRYIAQSLRANVQWHPEDYSVDITTPRPLTLKQLNKIGEGVGIVYALDAGNNYISQGSGFMLGGGVFVTCSHVIIANTTSLLITVNGKSYTTNGQYLFNDPATDLAAVKIDAPESLKYTTTLPIPADKVYSLGFPKEKFQINEGFFASWDGKAQITHTATTDHGNSGGILINSNGEVIGVTSAKVENTDTNRAIPISFVLQELDKLNK